MIHSPAIVSVIINAEIKQDKLLVDSSVWKQNTLTTYKGIIHEIYFTLL